MYSRLLVTVALGFAFTNGTALAAKRYSPWSTPTALDAVNSAALEFANGISKDGLSFYFQRGDATVGGEDVWVAHREHKRAPWGAPQPLPPTVNSAANDRAAFVSADGHWLFFASDRPGGRGGFDLMVSWRYDAGNDFGWETALNLDDLGSPVNTPGFDSGPALLEGRAEDDGDDDRDDGEDDHDRARGREGRTQLYLVSNPAGPQNNAVDIYVSVQNRDGSFGPPAKVEELSDPAFNEGRPYLRHDGKEIFFNSNRTGSLDSDIWSSTRRSTRDAWAAPQRVEGAVNTAVTENTPVLSWDGRTLFFASNRTGVRGQIFFSTRQEVRGKDESR
jgi:hypothetical protein